MGSPSILLDTTAILCKDHFLKWAAEYHTFEREDIKRQLKEIRDAKVTKSSQSRPKKCLTPKSKTCSDSKSKQQSSKANSKDVAIIPPRRQQPPRKAKKVTTIVANHQVDDSSKDNPEGKPGRSVVPFLTSISSHLSAPTTMSPEERGAHLKCLRRKLGLENTKKNWLASLKLQIEKECQKKSEVVGLFNQKDAVKSCIWNSRDLSCVACVEEWTFGSNAKKGGFPDGIDVEGTTGSHRPSKCEVSEFEIARPDRKDTDTKTRKRRYSSISSPTEQGDGGAYAAFAKSMESCRSLEPGSPSSHQAKRRKTRAATAAKEQGGLVIQTDLFPSKIAEAPMEATPSLIPGELIFADLDNGALENDDKEFFCLQWKLLTLYVDVCVGKNYAKILIIK